MAETTVTLPAQWQSGEQLRQAEAAGMTPAEARDWWARVVERVRREHPAWHWRAGWSEVIVPVGTAASDRGRETVREAIRSAIAAEPWDPDAPEATR